ncbi:hypothetical protein FJT64_001541 [Amphibalanus amphitrite]|uniref:Uncharacterized protein n=1 Tax=Amphibalanus amphitrite TaxID=1232801 RepID=A0A6A4XH31_AMPAM|nr:hypothetical protein FJT64_001541 [Amphibalanus amphitrite]
MVLLFEAKPMTIEEVHKEARQQQTEQQQHQNKRDTDSDGRRGYGGGRASSSRCPTNSGRTISRDRFTAPRPPNDGGTSQQLKVGVFKAASGPATKGPQEIKDQARSICEDSIQSKDYKFP